MHDRDANALDRILAGCLDALEEEILAVRAELERRGLVEPLPATGGTLVEAPGAGLLYEWSLPPGRYRIRPDDAVRVTAEQGSGLGFVVRFDPDVPAIRLSLTEWLGRRPGGALLTFDPSWLLEALAGRLGQIRTEPERFHPETALRLLGGVFPRTGFVEPPPVHVDGLNGPQREALGRALGSDTQLVWGPPGTGKTRLLGHLAAALAAEGRVLVTATTNSAVDEAAARVVERMGSGAVRANRVVRVGAEHSPGGDARLGLDAAVERAEAASPGAASRLLAELETELGVSGGRAAGAPDPGLTARGGRVLALAARAGEPSLVARAGRLSAEIARAGRRVLEGADVVLSTFARLALREDLGALRFDSLLVDEAGAAPLPHVVHAAALVSGQAVALGDFQQLPAVVVSRGTSARRWLSRDLFRETGVVGEEPGALPAPGDRLCALLSEQYRMRPEIRALVSELFYGGRLRDAAERAGSVPHATLAVVDTTGLDPRVEREDGSRRNAVHLDVALQLLEVLARAGASDVAVVTPYRVQTRSLARRARARLGPIAPAALEVATIHRFQGREKNVVILDTVDAPPDRSWFLDETRNRDFPRLLNVALSRARELLVVLGTVDGLRRTLPRDALLNRALDRMLRDGIRVDGRRPQDLVTDIRGGSG